MSWKSQRIISSIACLGVALLLGACQEREVLVQPQSNQTQSAGQLAFRLNDAELLTVRATADSVRIEASRAGYPVQVNIGSVSETTVLANMAVGTWTLKVALYDASKSIRWYGEATVEVIPGKQSNVVVTLKRATGSIGIQIVLDTIAPSTDTNRMTLTVTKGSYPGYLPIESAWRTDSGIFIQTSTYCQAPVVRVIPDSNNALRFGANPDIMVKCRVGNAAPLTVFVPWTSCGNLTLLDAKGKAYDLPGVSCIPPPVEYDTVTVQFPSNQIINQMDAALPIEKAWRTPDGIYLLTSYDYFIPFVWSNLQQNSSPGSLFLMGSSIATFAPVKLLHHIVFVPYPPQGDVSVIGRESVRILLPSPYIPPSVDSSFTTYETSSSGGLSLTDTKYQLFANGVVVLHNTTPAWSNYDSSSSYQKAILHPDSLKVIFSILNTSPSRHPNVIPDGNGLNCRTDAPTITRTVVYADGISSTSSLNISNYCGPLPASWNALDRVDAILRALFP